MGPPKTVDPGVQVSTRASRLDERPHEEPPAVFVVAALLEAQGVAPLGFRLCVPHRRTGEPGDGADDGVVEEHHGVPRVE